MGFLLIFAKGLRIGGAFVTWPDRQPAALSADGACRSPIPLATIRHRLRQASQPDIAVLQIAAPFSMIFGLPWGTRAHSERRPT
ncbi:hypothetical protein JQ633_18465 [Bradyrhizobium tropiciagri]|uniref:hypothetical protein n=1 Tax=Bradyrhizobium tropiciagri TaxID=312253 RepID=UPI001BA4B84C|nr:hypothetical protein [Bradyrhizobium tropiciagri]MBR0872355.1 hypothetical protein [Bradyrhizobium tropiciagri]